MSYNVDNFKVKKLENFEIKLNEFDKKYFKKPKIDPETNKVKIRGDCEVCEFKGTLKDGILKDGILQVTKISIYGEGSGHLMNAVDELLKKSTGTLVATLVWEHGDTVEKLTVSDGIIKRKNI